MFYIGGTLIPKNKKIVYALTEVYGIGIKQAFNICSYLGISTKLKTIDLDNNTQQKLIEFIQNNHITQKGLYETNRRIIQKHITSKSYRGIRLKLGLPVNGQRTRSNYKTSRKKIYLNKNNIW